MTDTDKTSHPHAFDADARDRGVRRVIVIEGCANAAVLTGKLIVGLSTGSMAIIGDAVHSLTDIANNVIAWIVVKHASRPADRRHPYGHRKFETLAVFGLATLLVVLAIELALHAIDRSEIPVSKDGWHLALMLGVLVGNIVLSAWQRYWARRLASDILLADAHHTVADVFTTIVVIAGWQLSAAGYPWLDSLCALGLSAVVLYLAYGLFRRALPVLLDEMAVAPERLTEAVQKLPGIRSVRRVRSRRIGSNTAVDMVVTVDPDISTTDAHALADSIETLMDRDFGVQDCSIHVEPARPSGQVPHC